MTTTPTASAAKNAPTKTLTHAEAILRLLGYLWFKEWHSTSELKEKKKEEGAGVLANTNNGEVAYQANRAYLSNNTSFVVSIAIAVGGLVLVLVCENSFAEVPTPWPSTVLLRLISYGALLYGGYTLIRCGYKSQKLNPGTVAYYIARSWEPTRTAIFESGLLALLKTHLDGLQPFEKIAFVIKASTDKCYGGTEVVALTVLNMTREVAYQIRVQERADKSDVPLLHNKQMELERLLGLVSALGLHTGKIAEYRHLAFVHANVRIKEEHSSPRT